MEEKQEHTRHGGAYDRGGADRYYHRPFNPHYYVGDTEQSKLVPVDEMTPEEVDAYRRGFTECTERKEW